MPFVSLSSAFRCRLFPNNYWDKFIKRKVSLSIEKRRLTRFFCANTPISVSSQMWSGDPQVRRSVWSWTHRWVVRPGQERSGFWSYSGDCGEGSIAGLLVKTLFISSHFPDQDVLQLRCFVLYWLPVEENTSPGECQPDLSQWAATDCLFVCVFLSTLERLQTAKIYSLGC